MIYVEHISEQEKQILIDYFKKGPNHLTRSRAIAVSMSQQGMTVSAIAVIVDFAEDTIRQWIQDWNEKRLSTVVPNYTSNEHAAKLTKAQKDEIKQVLNTPDSLPEEFWSIPKLKEHVSTVFGIEYESDRSYHYLLKHCGLSFKLPTPFDTKRDDALVKQRMQEIHKEIKPYMKSDDWVVLVADETRLDYDEVVTRCWLPKGKKTVLKVSRDKSQKQHYFGALNLKDQQHHLFKMAWQDTENIVTTLTKLKQQYKDKRICLIWDNARWHKSKALREELTQDKPLASYHLIHFPPYAPDENPEEHVWKYGKEQVRKKHHASFAELCAVFETAVDRQFDYMLAGI